MEQQSLGIYIHIPFCVKKCDYCDFLSGPADSSCQEVYLRALLREIEAVRLPEGSLADTVFIGGGTPSAIAPVWIGQLLERLKQCVPVAETAEITLEANPGTLNREKLEVYRQAGINRLSMGLQSAQDAELAALGRIHRAVDFFANFQEARRAGFANINVDLMMAIPGQSPDSWKDTLKQVIRLKPEHISAYSLIVEPGTPFAERELTLPDEDEERDLYETGAALLEAAGYSQYEISNFAREGFACRHNIGYWERHPYLGFGLGAASLLDECRFSNTADMKVYLRDSGDPDKIRCDRERLSVQQQMEEFMFLGLRMIRGVSERAFAERFGRPLEQVYRRPLEKYQSLGLLKRCGGRVFLSGRGLSVSNTIMSDFLL